MTATPRRFGRVESVALIGGGDLMLETARMARGAGYDTVVILAPRHAEEQLPMAGCAMHQALDGDKFDVHVVDDINLWQAMTGFGWTGPNALAICFGPSWVFQRHVLEAFGAGMINFNGIPVPRYLGGAHYTWQIVNGDRSGGCVLQEITEDLDRGPILRRTLFELPEHVRVPQDYFEANFEVGKRFLETAIADMRADRPFEPIEFGSVENDRLYFPRLHTVVNGWIDWAWSAPDIERFCCAFDTPYQGGGTYMATTEVRLAGVQVEEGSFHPFNGGLVVRRLGGRAWVAASGGLLRVDTARLADGNDAMGLLREGHRLHTPRKKLDEAMTFRPMLTAKGFEKTSP